MKKFILLPVLMTTVSLGACVTNNEWMNAAQSVLNGTSSYGTSSYGTSANALTTSQITAGLKEALRVGTDIVVAQLGKQGGFNSDNAIRIPLPQTLKNVHEALDKIGMGGMTADLENRMNAAAEQAMPHAKDLFIAAIQQMTIEDARSILSGQQDAATQYLRKSMGAELAKKVQPIVNDTLAQTGAIQLYDRVTGQYAALPFVQNVKTDMNAYVTDKALDGVFHYVAKEEAAIRQNPAKRTTEILRTVFGN